MGDAFSVPFILSCLSNLRNAIDRETIKLRTIRSIEAISRTHGGVYMYGLVERNILQIDRSKTYSEIIWDNLSEQLQISPYTEENFCLKCAYINYWF